MLTDLQFDVPKPQLNLVTAVIKQHHHSVCDTHNPNQDLPVLQLITGGCSWVFVSSATVTIQQFWRHIHVL